MTVWKTVVYTIIAFLLLVLVASVVHAHGWYDTYCCNNEDCRPVSNAAEG